MPTCTREGRKTRPEMRGKEKPPHQVGGGREIRRSEGDEDSVGERVEGRLIADKHAS